MKPMLIILDCSAHPGISLFWKRHGLGIMEQLVPTKFLTTSKDQPLEQIMEQEVSPGWKKVILIGTPQSIAIGFNMIMSIKRGVRASLEIGFWSLNTQELATNLFHSTEYIETALHVFKAGKTLPVDVMKVQYLASKLITHYIWDKIVIKNKVASSSTSVFIDELDHRFEGSIKCRIAFNEESLSSLTIHPGKLKRNPVLQVYMEKSKGFLFTEWISKHLKNEMQEKGETLLKTGKIVEIQGNWANLEINHTAITDTVQSLHLSVEQKAFHLIIPANPIKIQETARDLVPKFLKPSTLTSSRDKSTDNWVKRND